jgi:broad specificity phosphatase PhoE
MANIYLVRHGQDEDNAAGVLNGRRDMPLTQKGSEQASAAGEILVRTRKVFGAIYHSPLRRTQQTALSIAEALEGSSLPLVAVSDLIERDFGIMTGKGKAAIPGTCSDILRTERIDYFLSGEGVESFPQVLARASRVLMELHQRHPEENIIAVSHGDVMMMLIAAHYALPWKEVLTIVHIDNSDIIRLSHDSGGFCEEDLLLR